MPFDGTNLNETAACLIRAKRHIEEHGWCSHGPRDGNKVCIAMAIINLWKPGEAWGARHPAVKAWSVMVSIVGKMGPWNDTPGRTLEEVLAAFDAAIALAMAEERVA